MFKFILGIIFAAWFLVQFPGAMNYAHQKFAGATPEKVVTQTADFVKDFRDGFNEGVANAVDELIRQKQLQKQLEKQQQR